MNTSALQHPTGQSANAFFGKDRAGSIASGTLALHFQFANALFGKCRGRQKFRGTARAAFTLLEVVIAVAIIGLLTVTLYRFVVSTLGALRISTEMSTERRMMIGLVNLIEAQLNDLPTQGQALLLGQPHKFHELESDEMQWLCRAGQGLLTSAALGQYRVTLELKPVEKTSAELELVLRRRPVEGTEKDDSWISLMRPVAALEIRYFHPQLNAWVERWNDQNRRPSLVRISITRNVEEPPYEAVLTLPASNLQQ
jgi:prepilin-type N-terminal cleavage/methylation domain-containing protein